MQVRTDLLARAVWRAVSALLEHPDRLTEEYRRRLHPHAHARRHDLTTVEGQLGRLRQGLARLIDSYAEGLMEKREFEPRITHLRQRVTKLEEQAHHLADAAVLPTELQLIIGRLEEFAAQVKDGLEEADGTSRRELIRALVKRVEVDNDQVHVVFRIDHRPGDPSPEKKVCTFVGGVCAPSCGAPSCPAGGVGDPGVSHRAVGRACPGVSRWPCRTDLVQLLSASTVPAMCLGAG